LLGAWQLRMEMEAKISDLEEKIEHLESCLKQEQKDKTEFQSALDERNHIIELKDMELTKVNTNRMATERNNYEMKEEIAQKNQMIVDLVMKCQEMGESIQKNNEALEEECQQSEKYHTAMLSAQEECVRLRDLLYQVQEKEAILQDQVHQQTREIRILTKAKRSKDDHILSLIKEKDAIIQNYKQLKHPKIPAFKPVLSSIPPAPIPKKSANKIATTTMDRKSETISSTKALETLENYPKISLLLKNLTHKNQLLEETNDQLKDQIRILQADQKTLLTRFREAHTARKRAEQKAILSLR
jgi:chromosome segregation ATPase